MVLKSGIFKTLNFKEAIKVIRDVPDFPKKGIVFKDITPLFENIEAFEAILEELSKQIANNFDFNKFACIESRGFLLGSALAYKMKIPFVLIRKPGKLPGEVYKESYDLEYGSDSLELLKSSLNKEDNVLIIDDILATGGTVEAVEKLCQQSGASVSGTVCLMELGFLNGRKKLKKPFYAPITL